MLAPGMRPNSATAVEVCNLKSCTASTEIMESRLPKALRAGSAPPLDCAGRPPALTPVLALTPSTVKRLVLGRMPLVVNWPASPRVAGITLVPGINSSRVMTPRPLSGSWPTSSRSNWPPAEASGRSSEARDLLFQVLAAGAGDAVGLPPVVRIHGTNPAALFQAGDGAVERAGAEPHGREALNVFHHGVAVLIAVHQAG